MIKAVIFDMDGLMIESETLHFDAYRKALENFSVKLNKDDYWKVWGTDKEICERLVAQFKIEKTWKELLWSKNKIFRDHSIHKIKPQKGLFDLLNKLQKDNYLLAVASGSQMDGIEIIFKNLKIGHYFKTILSAESVKHGKPAPDIFLLAAEKLKVNPSECLVLEDSPKGVISAKKAGMKCYAIPSPETNNSDFSSAYKILNSLEEVYSCLKKES